MRASAAGSKRGDFLLNTKLMWKISANYFLNVNSLICINLKIPRSRCARPPPFPKGVISPPLEKGVEESQRSWIEAGGFLSQYKTHKQNVILILNLLQLVFHVDDHI